MRLSEAIQELFPEATLVGGMATEQGFYYDVDFRMFNNEMDLVKIPFDESQFRAIEEKIKQIAARSSSWRQVRMSNSEAQHYFTKQGNKYLVEFLIDARTNQHLDFYEHGHVRNLYYGPCIPSTKIVKSVTILATAEVHWLNDQSNDSITRIFGRSSPE